MKSFKNYDANIICFDFWDTIVYRKHSPQYSSLLWCRNIIEYFGLDITLNQLLFIRKNIIEVCDKPYRECIRKFVDALQSISKYHIDFEKFYEVAKKIDYSIEFEEIQLNKSLINQIKKHKNQFEKCVLISDFYLDKDFYFKILNKLGILDLFDEIFISSDLKKTKSSGKLYEYVKDIYKDKKLLMIGDSKDSDFLMPKNFQFESILYNNSATSIRKLKYKARIFLYDNMSIKRYKKIFNKRCDSGIISNYAFSIYDFCEKLYKHSIKSNIKTLYFLSREGQFLKKAFEEYQKDRGTLIECKYLCINRYSTFLPSLFGKDIIPQTFQNLLMHYKDLSIEKFLKNCQFSDEEIYSLELINIDKVILNLSDSEDFASLLHNEKFKSVLVQKIEKTYHEFKIYFDNLTENSKELYLVDVGWKGTMQDNLSFMFPKIKFHGLYLGLNGYLNINENSDKRGILFNLVDNPYNFHAGNFELILKANHGKVVTYSNGQPVFVKDGDTVAYETLVGFIQDDIFEKFKAINKCRHLDVSCFTVNNILMKMHIRMIKKSNFKFYKKLFYILSMHDENFGLLLDNSGKSNKINKYIIKNYIHYHIGIKKFKNYE